MTEAKNDFDIAMKNSYTCGCMLFNILHMLLDHLTWMCCYSWRVFNKRFLSWSSHWSRSRRGWRGIFCRMALSRTKQKAVKVFREKSGFNALYLMLNLEIVDRKENSWPLNLRFFSADFPQIFPWKFVEDVWTKMLPNH